MKSRTILLASILFTLLVLKIQAQHATITEKLVEFKTYPFSDPNPIPEVNRIYPYFYFHGYTNQAIQKQWKMVVLENDYIKVFVCPEIGGKVWGAIEKSTGKEFLYFNHVVKFRDVAMRGAWTSGGLEYNFGDIGHIPTCATPVDYLIKENEDGSVSCVVGAVDLPSGTKWNVEISLHPNNAYFETKTSWFNQTNVPTSFYHWMNAAAKASDDLEFIYPGNKTIGHGGEGADWPVDEGRDISWYKNNNFGSYKSYHVINSYSDFFGGYWHDDDFGFGHWSTYDDKPGKKLWIWGLSEEGMIWEDLLTDNDGQYIEFQAGKLFNQAAYSSMFTPFKHREFQPHDADISHEIWFPLKNTGGMKAASPTGVINIEKKTDSVLIVLSALQPINDELKVLVEGELLASEKIILKPLEIYKLPVKADVAGEMKVILGESKLIYSTSPDELIVNRPINPYPEFDWNSAYGLFTKGLGEEKQRRYNEAMEYYLQAIKTDPGFLPALSRIALSHYRQMNYGEALSFAMKALAIDTYYGEANYIFGLTNRELGNFNDAKSGFSVAMMDVGYRAAAATELAAIFLKEENYNRTEYYAQKALENNQKNLKALEILAVTWRKTGQYELANYMLRRLFNLDAINHFIRFEEYLLNPVEERKNNFTEKINNELPFESHIGLAVQYYDLGCEDEALQVLEFAPEHPVVNLWKAFLDENNSGEYLQKCLEASPQFVFPHRKETAFVLNHFLQKNNHWKLNYYAALISLKAGLKKEAIRYFEACKNEPDFAPFWLAKANLSADNKERFYCLQKATKLEPDDWRASINMAQFYLDNREPAKALEITGRLTELHREQSAIGITHARAMIHLGNYREAISFLENYEVLPFEGATVGRDIYHEACLRQAFDFFESKNYKQAIKNAKKAKNWPANLGVGRPYEVDERIEDFLIARAFKELGNKEKASVFEQKVTEYVHPSYTQENSRLFLQLILLKQNNRGEEVIELIHRHKFNYPDNIYIQWIDVKFNEPASAEIVQKRALEMVRNIQPYDTQFIDKQFKLLLDLLSVPGISEK